MSMYNMLCTRFTVAASSRKNGKVCPQERSSHDLPSLQCLHRGPFQDDFLQLLMKSRIAQALFDMGVKHRVQDEDVQLGYKPNKSVIALKSFAVTLPR